jgi:hypothetical protein
MDSLWLVTATECELVATLNMVDFMLAQFNFYFDLYYLGKLYKFQQKISF